MAKKETISDIAAAQRLGISAKEVRALWEKGELKGEEKAGVLAIEKDSVFFYSELSESANQGKRKGGRKPTAISYAAVMQLLNIDEETLYDLVHNEELESIELTTGGMGVTERSVKKYQKDNKESAQTKEPEKPKQEVVSCGVAAAELNTERLDIELLIREGKLESADMKGGAIGVTRSSLDAYKAEREETTKKTWDKEAENIQEKKAAEVSEDDEKETETEEVLEQQPGTDIPERQSEESVEVEQTRGGEELEATEEKKKDAAAVHKQKAEEALKKIFPGAIQLSLGELMAMAHACEQQKPKYTEEEMKRAEEFAYMKGKIAVYDSMESFERRVQ